MKTGHLKAGDRDSRAVAVGQGLWYLVPGCWALLRRTSYRERHQLEPTWWLIRAQGGWLSTVGATLIGAGLSNRRLVDARRLGVVTALMLGWVTLASGRKQEVPAPIYWLDFAGETTWLTAWAATTLRQPELLRSSPNDTTGEGAAQQGTTDREPQR